MNFFQILALSLIWTLANLRKALFWIWLWQLKEHHLGRFLAHFQTFKGKRLWLNIQNLIKVLILLTLFFNSQLFVSLSLIWFSLEFLISLKKAQEKRIFLPKITLRTSLEIAISCLLLLSLPFLTFFLSKSLVFTLGVLILADLLAPLFYSIPVLGVEPLASKWRKRLMLKARLKRENFENLKVIGVTGSYGKTSTKELIAFLLSHKFKVLKTKEHENSEVGISKRILEELSPDVEIFVCEMGAYNQGGIEMLCQIALPQFGVLTGINQQHLATFGSQENIIKTKFELVHFVLERGGKAFCNLDNKFIREYLEKNELKDKVFLYSKEDLKADIFTTKIKVFKDKINFEAQTKDEKAEFEVKVVGKHYLENILGALLVAKELGLSLKESSQIFKNFESQLFNTLEKGILGADLIDSSYSANPFGVLADLEHLKLWKGNKIVVMPCLIELGPKAKEVHLKIAEKIAQVCNLAIITSLDFFKMMQKKALEKGMAKDKFVFLENPQKIADLIEKNITKDSVILLEGRVPKELKKLLLI